MMDEDPNNFSKAANACEHLNLRNANLELQGNGVDKFSISTQSFETRFMNAAWTICYSITFIILLFLLFLWYYFETISKEKWNDL